jgi:hypothetical protein
MFTLLQCQHGQPGQWYVVDKYLIHCIALMECFSSWRYPWAGMIPMVSGRKNFVLKTKLQAEAIVMHFWKGSMPFMWYETNYRQRFDFQRELLSYCRSDVDILRRACLTFRQLFLEMTSADGHKYPFLSSSNPNILGNSDNALGKKLMESIILIRHPGERV